FVLPCFANATNFTNFVYQVSMTMNSNGQGGIIFCANKSQKQYYLFTIDTNGNYTLELYTGGKYALLAQGTNTAILSGVGTPNTLTVLVDKGVLTLFVNASYVGGANNTTLSSGQIGVAVINRDLPTSADFSNVEVWNVA
ncbi:MAG: hypothetical protein ACRDHZ_19160, partial [Ktedonobacteraceae bacterium]